LRRLHVMPYDRKGITGQYEIQIEVGGRQVSVRRRIVDGVVNIGTLFIPWKH
jgi:hypothetical protein